MRLRWNGYLFDDNEVTFTITRRANYSPRGRRVSTHHVWWVEGVKMAADAANLTAALLALEAAMMDGGDLEFFDNNGTLTAHSMTSAGTINGIQVMGPVQYPGGNGRFWGSGTEYVNKRTYRVGFQADVLTSEDDLFSFRETLTGIGNGGPLNIWQESLLGSPQLQTPKAFTKTRLIQQGESVGVTSYQPYGAPVYGAPYYRNDLGRTSHDSPRKQNRNVDLLWPRRWLYVFEGPTAL